MPLKMSSAKWWPFCLTLNVLTQVHTCFRGWSQANTETPSADNTAVIHLIGATQWLNFNFSLGRECFLRYKNQCGIIWNQMYMTFLLPKLLPARDAIWLHRTLCNGLVPDRAKPLPKPMLIYHQWGSFFGVHLTSGWFLMKCPRSIAKMCLKMMHLKLSPHLPEASALLIWTQRDHLSYLSECKAMLKWCSIQGVHIWFRIYTVVRNYI